MNINEIIKRNIKNIPGKKTKQKIIVVYADDYGSVRTKNRESYNFLKSKGVSMDSSRFSKYDTLADEEDLNKLYDVLTSVKDSQGSYACMTPFVNVANPDFVKIKESGFKTYYREPFTETLNRYGKFYDNVFELWEQGISENVFYPAFHGTEHINVKRFMKALNSNHKSSRLAFDVESVCVPSFPNEISVNNPTTTYFIEDSKENNDLIEEIKIGTGWFNELFGYRTKQFTPGAGIYSPLLHQTLADNGIKYLNVNRYKEYPFGNGKFIKKFLSNGKENEIGQKYIVRNCVFEPSGSQDMGIVNKCIKDIDAAFRWGAPAIISTHRVNYIGHFDKKWRNNSLYLLQKLLKRVVIKNPDIIFMNGDQMAKQVFN